MSETSKFEKFDAR